MGSFLRGVGVGGSVSKRVMGFDGSYKLQRNRIVCSPPSSVGRALGS